jgi:beta-glucosidase
LIGQPLDFLGLNVYSRLTNRAARFDPFFGVRQHQVAGPTTAMGWEIYPASISEALLLAREYTDRPLYIAENGAAFADQVLPDGTIEDDDRVAYLRAHLAEVRRAIAAGVNVQGYFVWSLLDNFE